MGAQNSFHVKPQGPTKCRDAGTKSAGRLTVLQAEMDPSKIKVIDCYDKVSLSYKISFRLLEIAQFDKKSTRNVVFLPPKFKIFSAVPNHDRRYQKRGRDGCRQKQLFKLWSAGRKIYCRSLLSSSHVFSSHAVQAILCHQVVFSQVMTHKPFFDFKSCSLES